MVLEESFIWENNPSIKKKLPQFTVLMAQRLSNFPKVPEPVDDKSPDERTEMGASV